MRAQFPHIIAKIHESYANKDSVDNFLNADILTTLRYQHNKRMSERMLRVGQDSRGAPVNRTMIGGRDHYFHVLAKRE